MSKKKKKKCPTCGVMASTVYKDGTCCHCNNPGATKEALEKAWSKPRVCAHCGKEFLGHVQKALCPECEKIRIEVKCNNPYCQKKFKLDKRASLEYLTGRKKDHYYCSHDCSRGGHKYCNICDDITYFAGWTTCLKHNNPFSKKEVQEKCKETSRKNFGTDNPMQSEKGKQLAREGVEAKYGEGVINPFQAEEVQEKCRLKHQENFGVDNPFQAEEIKEKSKQTNLEKYGFEHASQSPEIKAKTSANYKAKTGYDNPGQNPEVKAKSRETYFNRTGFNNPAQNPEVQAKMKATYMKRTGYDSPSKNPEVKAKKVETYRKRTGYDNPAQNPEVIEKMKASYRDKTGYDNPQQNPEVRAKSRETCRKRYGCEYPSQNPEILRKSKSKGSWGIRTKIVFPNQTIMTRSFWETIFALYLYKNNVKFKYEALNFIYKFKNKNRHYHPDFYLPDYNYIVEIKGWQYAPEQDEAAWQAVIDEGYGFEVIWDTTFFEHWVINNTSIDLKQLKSDSRDCDEIFEFIVE